MSEIPPQSTDQQHRDQPPADQPKSADCLKGDDAIPPEPADASGESSLESSEARPGDASASFEHDALQWEPAPSTDGGNYVESDFRAELARHLPPNWSITEFQLFDPREKNHAGKMVANVTIEHDDAPAAVLMRRVQTAPNQRGPTVWNSHCVSRRVDGETTTVYTPRDMVSREHPATIFYTIVDAAQTFSNRYGLFH